MDMVYKKKTTFKHPFKFEKIIAFISILEYDIVKYFEEKKKKVQVDNMISRHDRSSPKLINNSSMHDNTMLAGESLLVSDLSIHYPLHVPLGFGVYLR